MNIRLFILFSVFSFVSLCAEVTISELLESKEGRREKDFKPWVTSAQAQQRFIDLNKKSMMPLYSQYDGGKERALWIKKPKRVGYYALGGMKEGAFVAKSEELKDLGFYLMTSSISKVDGEGNHFWGLWVDRKSLKKIKSKMRWYGITKASAESN